MLYRNRLGRLGRDVFVRGPVTAMLRWRRPAEYAGIRMKFTYNSTSPYVRRVAVTVIELGLEDRVERITVDNKTDGSDYGKINPLMKVPSLILDDGRALIDSTAICEYFDMLHNGPKLFPPAGDQRVKAMQLQVLVNGIQEAGTTATGERVRRPEHLRWPQYLDNQLGKVSRGLDRLETMVDLLGGPLDYAQLCTGVLCGWCDFRLPDTGWRDGRPGLAGWFEAFSQRRSMQETVHRLR